MAQATNPQLTEILVQDDCSPQFNMPLLLGEICQRNTDNLGFPGNCNAGAARARGDVIMFVNHDVWVQQRGWDSRLLSFFEIVTKAGVAGPTLLFPDGRVQSVGGEFDSAGHPYHTALGASNPDWEPIAKPRIVDWITGAAFAVRATLWRELGGFSTDYIGGYFEDVDFCLRAEQAGYGTWHRPNIRMYHGVGSTGGNPHFMHNAMLFKSRWVDTKIVTPGIGGLRERWWA
jgi:GT2 family glycosyltransferase